MTPHENYLHLYQNRDLSDRTLTVLGHEIDDLGGTEGSYEYAMQHIRKVAETTHLKIEELGVLPWKLPETVGDDPLARYLPEITKYARTACDRSRAATEIAIREGRQILSLGGNHLRAVELPGVLEACHKHGIELGVFWTDAHPDFNTPETTASGNVHGQVSSLAMGHGAKQLLELLNRAPALKPENVVFFGINAPDAPEIKELRKKRVRVFTTADIDLRAGGLNRVIAALKNVNKKLGPRGMWWHELDVDVLDDKESRGKVMDNESGLTARELHSIYLWVGKMLKNLGMGVSEIAPKKDPEEKMAKIVTGCIARCLGRSNIQYDEHKREHGITLEHRERVSFPFPASESAIAVNADNGKTGEPAGRPTHAARKFIKKASGWTAAAAAAVLAFIMGRESSEPTRTPRPSEGPAPYVLLSHNGADTQYAWTGIASTNRFYPPPFQGRETYSAGTVQRMLEEYLEAAKYHPTLVDTARRRLYSCLYVGEQKGVGSQSWQTVHSALGSPEEYWRLVDGYRPFKETLDESEVREWMKLWNV